MDIDLNWCVCGCRTANQALYCSPDCYYREVGLLPPMSRPSSNATGKVSLARSPSRRGESSTPRVSPRSSASSYQSRYGAGSVSTTSDEGSSVSSESPPSSFHFESYMTLAGRGHLKHHDQVRSRPALNLAPPLRQDKSLADKEYKYQTKRRINGH